uniref:KIB1-4 beta-propeller domain-containing protein n=1 Tax=Leersia perrieri TaxID=77586 RepID=A0A0D9X8G9_9ORYZ
MEINNNSSGSGGDCPSSLPRLHVRDVPVLEGKLCLGCVHDGDCLLMVDEITNECFLFCLSNSSKISLPPLREPLEDIGACVVLGSSPVNQECTVVISSLPEPEESFLLHCHPGDEEWTKLIAQDHSHMLSGSLVNCAGQLYSFSTHGRLVTVDVIDGVVQPQENIGWERSCDSPYETYLIESVGDLFLVAASAYGCPYDWPLVGVSVEAIGEDRAFLIAGRYGFSYTAVEGLVQGNCIYIVWGGYDCERLYKFCLDDMTISFQSILPHPTKDLPRGFWSVPAEIQTTEFKDSAPSIRYDTEVIVVNNFNEDEDQHATTVAPWQDLPTEMLRRWRSISNPVAQAKVWPWLMHCGRQDGTLKMFDPLQGIGYTMKVGPFNAHKRQTFRFSKDGWVIVSHGDKKVFVINPFTEEIVKLPKLPWRYLDNGISFSTMPTSPYCIFLGVGGSPRGDGIRVSTCRPNNKESEEKEAEAEEEDESEEENVSEDEEEDDESDESEYEEDDESEESEYEDEEDGNWIDHFFDTDDELFPVAHNNPVYFREEFYFLGQRGNLSVFNPGNNEWRILKKPEPIHANLTPYDEGSEACYLVELRGELIAVFHRNANEPPRVLKLNESTMAWVDIEDIGGGTLFLDYRASMAVPSPEAGHGNRIYFPRFSEDGKQAIFYDLEAKKYIPTFCGAKEPMNCVPWLVQGSRGETLTFVDVSDMSLHETVVPEV